MRESFQGLQNQKYINKQIKGFIECMNAKVQALIKIPESYINDQSQKKANKLIKTPPNPYNLKIPHPPQPTSNQAMRNSTTQQKQKQQQKQSQIKYMQTILQHPIIELQRLKNRQLINLKTNIGKLKYFVDFMRYKLYLDFNDDGKGPKIESYEAIKKVCSELEKLCPVYFHLIVDRLIGDKLKPYDPLLLKLRPSPYQSHSYFMNFHDLQALDKIEPQPAADSIEFLMKQVRRVVFLEPKRQKMQQDARKKWQQFRQIQSDPQITQKQKFVKRFTQYPSESQCYTQQEIQQALYTIDDLEIDFDGYEKEQQQQEEQQNRNVENIRRFMEGSFGKFYELEREMDGREENEEEEETFC